MLTARRFAPSISAGLLDWLDDSEPLQVRPALQCAADALLEAGVDLGNCQWWRLPDAILITEAVNWAAKVIDWSFYDLKPDCIRECVELGAEGGWRGEIFYLYHHAVGVASFHDPYGQIDIGALYWPWEWSGVTRQDAAFELLTDLRLRRQMAYATAPGDLGEWCRSWLWQAKPRHKLP